MLLRILPVIAALGGCGTSSDEAVKVTPAAAPVAPAPKPAAKAAVEEVEIEEPAADPCPGKTGDECVDLGLYTENGTGGQVKDLSRAVALFRAGCERKHLKGCAYLADMLLDSKGTEPNDAEALSLYTTACLGGVAIGCLGVGILYDRAQGVEQDDTKAFDWYSRACRAGSQRGCVYVGDRQRDGRGTTKDVKAAIKAYTAACKANEGLGCVALGYQHEIGEGVPKDLKKAIALYRDACEHKEPKGCAYTADMYEVGTGVRKNLVTAVELDERGCTGGYYASCAALGVLYTKGEGGVTKDIARATELSELACEHRQGRGCHVRGWILELGGATGKTLALAMNYFEKGCALDYYESCWAAGDLYHARKTKRDGEKAKRLLSKACTGNQHEKACAMLLKIP